MNAHDHAFPPLARAGALLKLTTALLLGKEATKSHKRLFKCKLITMTNSVPLLHWPHTLQTTPSPCLEFWSVLAERAEAGKGGGGVPQAPGAAR